MNRRSFLGSVAAAALPAIAGSRTRTAAASGTHRVVVAGGGVAGVTFALALKRLAPDADILMVDPGSHLLFTAATLEYVFGHVPFSAMTRSYDWLKRRGIAHLRAQVTAVEPRAQRVRTSGGTIDYRYLVLSSGIRAATEDISGLDAAPEANVSLYERSRLDVLRDRIAGFAGGTALLYIPPPPHSCPPAAYEFALLFAEHLRAKEVKGRMLILDANAQPQPAPLAAALDAALQGAGGLIEHVPSIRVARLEAQAKRVISADGESFSYALLSLIAPHKAAAFIAEAGLSEGADPFVQVDPVSFRSPHYETIYAFGDAARTPYARAAQSAYEAAIRCAHRIARVLGARVPGPEPLSFEVPCYPYVNPAQALSLRLAYRVKNGAIDADVIADSGASKAHALARRSWQQRLLHDVLAA
jgi:sulfide dehydrogenase [flavocytochrome c] flavoprotein chain